MGRVDDDRKLREANYIANLKAGKVKEPLASTSNSVAVVRPLSKYEAGVITSRINSAAVDLCTLVLEAHDRLAYKALGYSSWEAYAAKEFSFGRSRSYQLLTQGQVKEAVRIAATAPEAKCPPMVDISERESRDLKPNLTAVTDEIRDRVASGESPESVVPEVIKKTRQKRQPKPKDSPIPLSHPGYEGAGIEAMNDARFGATTPTPPPEPDPARRSPPSPSLEPDLYQALGDRISAAINAQPDIPPDAMLSGPGAPPPQPSTVRCPQCGHHFKPDPY